MDVFDLELNHIIGYILLLSLICNVFGSAGAEGIPDLAGTWKGNGLFLEEKYGVYLKLGMPSELQITGQNQTLFQGKVKDPVNHSFITGFTGSVNQSGKTIVFPGYGSEWWVGDLLTNNEMVLLKFNEDGESSVILDDLIRKGNPSFFRMFQAQNLSGDWSPVSEEGFGSEGEYLVTNFSTDIYTITYQRGHILSGGRSSLVQDDATGTTTFKGSVSGDGSRVYLLTKDKEIWVGEIRSENELILHMFNRNNLNSTRSVVLMRDPTKIQEPQAEAPEFKPGIGFDMVSCGRVGGPDFNLTLGEAVSYIPKAQNGRIFRGDIISIYPDGSKEVKGFIGMVGADGKTLYIGDQGGIIAIGEINGNDIQLQYLQMLSGASIVERRLILR